mmetsp:Transcript_28663/g.75915  ORF Transcript_28663/g.75915 Transcript_28663/m.75915 type:complete len:470 (-) Transcript_28663:78-1487(-)
MAQLLLLAALLASLAPAAAGANAGDQAAAANDANATNVSSAQVTHTVALRKQYVPIMKNGAAVAYKTAYFGQIYAGSPTSQPFTVVFDTGSGHLILPSTACRSETCLKHRQYDRLKSETALDIEYDGTPILPTAQERDQLRISFGTGSVEGEFVEDVACLGPAGTAGEHCTKLRIVLATSMSAEPFGLFDFDGVLGLGANALSLNSHFSFFGQMVAQHPTMQPRFAVRLARNDEGRSAISFGGIDARWLAAGQQEDVRWAPVAMPELGYWQVQIKEVRIGDTVLDDCADGGCRAILDTGTSLLGVPRQAMRGMHRLLARPVPAELSNPGDDPDCRALAGKMLHFDLDLGGGTMVSLGPEDYSRPKPYNMTMPGGSSEWKLWCRSLLLPIDMKEPLGPRVFIWGEAVLRRYLTVYDWENQRIGFSVSGTADEPVDGDSSAIGAPPAGSLAAGSPLVAPKATPPATEEVRV